MTSTGSARTLTLAEIVSLTGAVPRDATALARRITGIAPIDHAGPGDLTFVDNPKFAAALAVTRAGAVLTTERFEAHVPASVNLLRTREPYRAFVMVAREFYRDRLRPTSPYEADGVMPGAHVHPSAQLGAGVTVDPGAVIGPRVVIGAGTSIGANTVIGANVRIGCDCAIGPSCTVIHSELGNRVILHPGCRIGQDGFGYVSSPEGHAKVPQVGRVVIHDDVEIGAGTTVDRGGIRDTVIGEGTKIDNLVQIGHNVVIGRHCDPGGARRHLTARDRPRRRADLGARDRAARRAGRRDMGRPAQCQAAAAVDARDDRDRAAAADRDGGRQPPDLGNDGGGRHHRREGDAGIRRVANGE
jgi:UDP-3-O-[3-hydroxymyristoyl] glucosamine N-acyltransferase